MFPHSKNSDTKRSNFTSGLAFSRPGNASCCHQSAERSTRKAVNTPEFKTAMEKMETPIAYLDADDFQKFWDNDAKRLIQGVRNIGKVQ